MTLDSGAEARQAPAPKPSGKLHHHIGSFEPELGGYLPEVVLAYETWGELDHAGENAVLIVHALTGDSHAAGDPSADYKRGGWWDPMIGPERTIDTDNDFVICSNVLGGCSGSTGPASTNPETGRPYGMGFPIITIRDMVRAQKRLLDDLGVKRLKLVIGGSIGGQQALEWAVEFPGFVERAAPVAATGALGPQGIAMSEIGRRAIMADPDWRGGSYASEGVFPATGLAIARMVGMVTYHSKESMNMRFGRNPATRPALYPAFGPTFDVEGYIHYHGEALTKRFDANSFLYLTRAMDLYDVGRDGGESAWLRRIEVPVSLVGIRSDWLFPAGPIRDLRDRLRALGKDVEYQELDSPHGHDAFLKEWGQLTAAIGPFVSARIAGDP